MCDQLYIFISVDFCGLEYEYLAWKEAYRRYVGTMWKTLEVAMNHADLKLDFCVFFCSQVMQALQQSECGGMSFVPILKVTPNSTSSAAGSVAVPIFLARVRYRAEGHKPGVRYRQKVTRTQSRSDFLLRPFLAAQGVLPSTSASSRRK